MLSKKGIAIGERDFFKDPFSEDELRGLMNVHASTDLFSWRSPSFKAMGLDADSLGDDDLVRLMLQEPRLIRRPLVQIGDVLVIGADIKGLENALERA